MTTPSPETVSTYTVLLKWAILELRARIRYADSVSIDEVHDFLDALHNVPIMLLQFGDWHVEENIDADLARYDQKWVGSDNSTLRTSLVETLQKIRAGELT